MPITTFRCLVGGRPITVIWSSKKRLKEKGKRAEKEDGEVEKRKNGFSAIDVKFFIPELFLDR